MKIRAVIPSVREESFKVSDEITVPKLKGIICKKLGIEPDLTQLLLNGIALKDDEGLKAKSNVQIQLIVDYYWGRNLILWGLPAQRILRNSTVLIAGAGALGCEVAENLGMIGVGNLTIIDYDQIELSNLSRMAPYTFEDVGRLKARVLAEKLEKNHPFLSIKTVEERLEKSPKKIFLDSDIIVSCLDNIPSRIYLIALAVRYSIPIVDAGIIGYQGRVQSYMPPGSACPACMIPAAQYPQLAELRNPCTPDINEEAIPSLSTSNKLIAAIQSHEIIKILLSSKKVSNEIIGEHLVDILLIDLKYNRYSTLPIKRNKKCIVCGDEGIAKEKSTVLTVSAEKILTLEFLNNLTKNRKRKVDDYTILMEDEAKFIKVEKDEWNNAFKLAKGKYIYVIFKSKSSEEYKEILFKVSM
jgi:molybdopterin/thiamine biosynthesis adenylyltransferase